MKFQKLSDSGTMFSFGLSCYLRGKQEERKNLMTMIRRKNLLLFPLIVLSLCWSEVQPLECPEGQLPRHNGTKCCEPYFNCGKNHMIEPCSEDGTKDKCEQCQGGAINNHVTSSINDSWMKYRCFNVTKEQLCSPEDLLPYSKASANCALFCECDIYKCRYGNQCSCDQQLNPCGLDEELNTSTGVCVPCRPHTYKNVTGCQPCTWNETSWRMSLILIDVRIPEVTTKITLRGNKPTLKEIVTTGDETYVVTTKGGEPRISSSTDQGADDGGTPVAAIVIPLSLVFVLVIFAISVAVCLKAKKRRQDGDNSPRLVLWYRVITCRSRNQSLETEVEVEQGKATANGGENGIGHEKPQHAVSPMRQITTQDPSPEEVPFCDMSLTVNGNTQNESLTPLMSGTAANNDSEEQTAEKQP